MRADELSRTQLAADVCVYLRIEYVWYCLCRAMVLMDDERGGVDVVWFGRDGEHPGVLIVEQLH